MDIQQILSSLNEDIIARFKTAVEIGKWANGVALTDEQRAICLQAIVVWDNTYLKPEQRVGYIDRGTKASGESCDSHEHSHDHEHDHDNNHEQPVSFRT